MCRQQCQVLPPCSVAARFKELVAVNRLVWRQGAGDVGVPASHKGRAWERTTGVIETDHRKCARRYVAAIAIKDKDLSCGEMSAKLLKGRLPSRWKIPDLSSGISASTLP
jgi:hypothetical protein